ncbi:MAG TPA: NAD(P)H-hydrate dehydratase [Candidatus Methylacidiphilales bacterium]|jgi:NAD(P)H-hydrate epimerase|nr:NAD(P)H-hydrate dehydratase [Candidatus Methylacidiphilales bacterium]
MDILTTKEMLAREAAVFRSGVTAGALMEAAGAAMFERIVALYPHAGDFLVLIGKGNNGGDGLVVARHLARGGAHVEIALTAPENDLGELPVAQLAKLRADFPGVPVMPWSRDVPFPDSHGVVLDGLLGVQARGPLRGNLGEVVAAMNAAREARFFRTVALDLPSGLSAYEEGPAPKERDAAVVADVTIAVGFAKSVLAREALAGWVGRLEVVPWSTAPETGSKHQILVGSELAHLLPRRSALSYKNNFGKLTIVAGSRGFTGAPVLCAHGAQGIGAGLLSIITQDDAAEIVAAKAPPEAMVSGWTNLDETPAVIANASAIVIGPGLGTSEEAEKMLRRVLVVGCPVLIDADGLNLLAKNLALLEKAKGPFVVTPHVGEMARLVGCKFPPDEREAVARDFVEKHNVTLVLKGTRTLVASAGEPLYVNTTGNPGLATGGSGDTLSGIIGGLLAQGLVPVDAARLGVWLHGHAADMVLAERETEEGLTPTMLADALGAALASLRAEAAVRPGLLERAA